MNRIELHERALLNRALEGTDELSGLRAIKGLTVQCDNPNLTREISFYRSPLTIWT
ncbi:MAG: hypothetical protein V8S96_08645 [Lachnospiraceae bacterium]